MEALLREARELHGKIPASLKEKIVLEHTSLIRYIVNRIAVRLPSHIDLDDLQNTGVIGLMDAIDKYDPEKNCKFKTYAEFRIKGAILDQLRSLEAAHLLGLKRTTLVEKIRSKGLTHSQR